MSIGEFCNRAVIVADRDCNVLEAARLMRHHHVGTVVVVGVGDGENKAIGIVTDRDLVVEVMAPNLDPETVTVGDIMADPLCSVREKDGVFDAIRLMRQHGVRRIPVVDDNGYLQGILTIDDVISLLAEEMDELAKSIVREQAKEFQQRK